MKVSQLKEQIRGIIRERSVKAIQKDYSNVVSDMEKHLELYKKSKGTPEEKKHIGHLKDLTAKKKKLQAELDLAVANLYKNAELKVDEAITNPKKTNPSDLAKTVLGWFDFYTNYIDDGGQRRSALKRNEDTLEWFGSHPKDVKEKAYKIMLSQAKGEKGQIERTFGKHLKESVNEAKTYKKGDKLKIKLPNGKKFDVVFVDYSGTRGIAFGKFKVDGEVATKPFSLSSIVESVIKEDIKKDIDKFIDKLNKQFPDQEYTISSGGGKYVRINHKNRKFGGGESAWGFISLVDNPTKGFKKGDLLKAAGYNTPAKHARGNILNGDAKYDKYSPTYLKEEINESENFNGYVSSNDGKTFTLYNSDKKKIKDVSFDDLKNKYMKTYLGQKLKDFKDSFDKTTSKGKYFQWWKGKLVNVKLSGIDESINEATEPEVISQLRDIVKTKQYQSVKDSVSGKKMKVDMQTANTVLKIYDGLSNVNKQTMVKMGLPKMIDVSNKIISKYR